MADTTGIPAPKPQALLNAQGQVHMLDDMGEPVTVAPEEFTNALQNGYQLDTKEGIAARRQLAEQQSLPNQALTVAEGAARGVSFGLSDPVLVGLLGEGYRKNAELRQR